MSSIYQISTLQALMQGYTKKATTVKALLSHGDTGLGTYENVDGEMIIIDGRCYQAHRDGQVAEADPETGVPFAACRFLERQLRYSVANVPNIGALKDILNNKIDEQFGLNSMHVVRIDGLFSKVYARSEEGRVSQHVELKEILRDKQQDFLFENIRGSLICLYFPDYMNGINAAGWHLHFISEDRQLGGHVFDIVLDEGTVYADKVNQVELQIPDSPAFDTYSLAASSFDDIKKVETGK